MNVVQMARNEYRKRIEQQKQVLEMLKSDSVQKLEKMGIITINSDNIPSEQEILHDSFFSTVFNRPYYNDGIYVYVCDLKDRGEKTNDRRYVNATIRNEETPLSFEGLSNVSVYIGLLTEKRHFIYPKFYDSFQHFNKIIHLPYPYTITETHGNFPDYFYSLGSWSLTDELLNVDGFREQFMALQEYFFHSLLEFSWEESVKEIERQSVLQKVCKRK